MKTLNVMKTHFKSCDDLSGLPFRRTIRLPNHTYCTIYTDTDRSEFSIFHEREPFTQGKSSDIITIDSWLEISPLAAQLRVNALLYPEPEEVGT